MGETISTLVFRPPPPTPIKLNKFFYIRIPNIEPKDYNCSASCGGMPPDMDMFPDADRLKNFTQTNHNKKSTISSLSGTPEEFKIPAFFLRRKGAKITILFSHGNAEDLGMMYRRMKEIAMSLCANVLAYDYTGYGLSTPSSCPPSEEMCYRNIEAAYNHLTKTMRIPPSEIILYGRSLGSGPSCHLAKKTADEGESVAGLILHSPFLSIYRIVLDCRVNLVGDLFINRSKAPDVRCPVLIIHGTKDDVVPFWHGDELLRSFPPECRAQPYWVSGVGHNHIEVKKKEEYVKRISAFIGLYILSQNQNGGPNGGRRSQLPAIIPEREQYRPEKTLQESGKFVVNQTWMKHGLAIVNEAMQDKKSKPATVNTPSPKVVPAPLSVPTKKQIQHPHHSQNSQHPQQSFSTSNPRQISNRQISNRQISKDPPHTHINKKQIEGVRTTLNITKLKTDDVARKAKHAEHQKAARVTNADLDSSQISSCLSTRSVESVASRYLLTKESCWESDDEGEDVSFDDEKVGPNDTSMNGGVSLQTFSAGNLSGFSLESSFIHEACELSLHQSKKKAKEQQQLKSALPELNHHQDAPSDERLDTARDVAFDRYNVMTKS